MATFETINDNNFVRWKKIIGTYSLTDLQTDCLPDESNSSFRLLEDDDTRVPTVSRRLTEDGQFRILEDG